MIEIDDHMRLDTIYTYKKAHLTPRSPEPEPSGPKRVGLPGEISERALMQRGLITCPYATLRAFGYALASYKKTGIGVRMNGYMVTPANSETGGMKQIRILNEYPDFIRVYYRRAGDRFARFYVLQVEPSGRKMLIDQSESPQRITL